MIIPEQHREAFERLSSRHQKKQRRGLRFGYRRLRAFRHGLPKCKASPFRAQAKQMARALMGVY